jgi:hypothetical protein
MKNNSRFILNYSVKMELIATFRTARALAERVGLDLIAVKGFVLIKTTDKTVSEIALVHPSTPNCII